MEIGVISYLLRHHGTKEAMNFLKEIGFKNVELDYRHVDDICNYKKETINGEKAKKILEEIGISPKAYCVGGLGQEDVENLDKVFNFAKELGVEVITGVLDPDILTQLDEYCHEYQIYYAIENHKGNVFEEADTILKALDGYSDYIGANVDTGHFAVAGLDPVEEIKKLSGKIYHAHFKDSDQKKSLGEGTVDLKGVLEELKKQKFDGLLSIEHFEYEGIDDETLKKGLTEALSYTKSLL